MKPTTDREEQLRLAKVGINALVEYDRPKDALSKMYRELGEDNRKAGTQNEN